VPTVDALNPRSWPSTGTTKVWTSQQDDMHQLTSISRRIIGFASRSQGRVGAAPGARATGSSSSTRRISNQATSGSSAIRPKAAR
jgi:hypothetical protein